MQLAARERRLDQIGGVHRAIRLPRPDKRMHLVDEQDDLSRRGLDLFQDRLQPFLEFAPIFRASDQRAHVKRHELLVSQALGNVTVHDTDRQTLGDRRLSDTGITNMNRIILFSAPKEPFPCRLRYTPWPGYKLQGLIKSHADPARQMSDCGYLQETLKYGEQLFYRL